MSDSSQSDSAPLKQVYLKHVRDTFVDQARVDSQWQKLNYLHRPDFLAAQREYEAFVELLRAQDIDVRFVAAGVDDTLDAVYVRDASVFCDAGAVLCAMGKRDRLAEPVALAQTYRRDGVSVLGQIEAPGLLEGGDVVWLDRRTLAVGVGYRTNAAGIDQLEELLGTTVDEVIRVPLPHWQGAQTVLHLMSLVSIVDRDLAVVYSPLMPVPFRQQLLARGFALLEVPQDEYANLACNVLATGPRRCMLAANNPKTKQALQAAGAQVIEFDGKNICLAGEGGPTCLTRPTRRADV